jgi:hypothetical protein
MSGVPLSLSAGRTPKCLIPGFDGALLSPAWREALWPKFCTRALPRQGRSVELTFERRNAVVPATCPVGLSAEFSSDPGKMTQWRACSGGTALEGKSFAEVTTDIWTWLEPACKPAP